MAVLQESSSSTGGSIGRLSLDRNSKVSDAHAETKDDSSAAAIADGDGLQRSLTNRKVQLVAIGGSIGTALFLSIGGVLNTAGPGTLFLAFAVYNVFLFMINNCMAEMTVYMPVSGSFIRMAGHWVDDALGFCVGWNFFLYLIIVIPFEITALTLVLSFWSPDIPVGAICGGCIVAYLLLNVFAVSIYGEAEFWLSGGKVTLLIMLFFFTFVTMVGGNPQHDAYGFRYWNDPGAFVEFSSTGDLGRFEAFLSAFWAAAFTCVGPEFVGMMAAEAQHPRTYVKTAYKVVYWRIVLFFIGGALAVGILVPYNDPVLEAVYKHGTGESGSAAASPYIIAMRNMNIPVLPHIATALLATTIFSAGNTYVYCATRSLYGLALEGRAPRIFTKCTKKGVPIFCIALVMLSPFLAFLQMGNGSATVLTWLINLATGATLVDNIVICITYVCFHRACKAQGLDRRTLPYRGWLQPWCGYLALTIEVLIATCYGYKSFNPFDVSGFVTAYTMPILVPILFVVWKLFKGTRWQRPGEVDLVWEAPSITAYEEALEERPIGFFRDCARFFTNKRKASKEEG